MTVTVPLPLGGKSSEELRIPPVVTSPRVSMPQLGMDFASKEIQIPTFTIPSEFDLSLPLMGMMEMSAKVNSNYYNWEGAMSVDSPSNMAKFSVVAKSPVELLAFSSEGNFIFIIFAKMSF